MGASKRQDAKGKTCSLASKEGVREERGGGSTHYAVWCKVLKLLEPEKSLLFGNTIHYRKSPPPLGSQNCPKSKGEISGIFFYFSCPKDENTGKKGQ